MFTLRWTDARLRYADRAHLAPIDVDEWGRDRSKSHQFTMAPNDRAHMLRLIERSLGAQRRGEQR